MIITLGSLLAFLESGPLGACGRDLGVIRTKQKDDTGNRQHGQGCQEQKDSKR